ncbi:MAG: hypothetical protein P4L71_01900 [Acetobacteraceae bacterium]|nr:hypothetical protein [Acetobacteraceae bacterium]
MSVTTRTKNGIMAALVKMKESGGEYEVEPNSVLVNTNIIIDGIKGLAEFLRENGVKVTGSDGEYELGAPNDTVTLTPSSIGWARIDFGT